MSKAPATVTPSVRPVPDMDDIFAGDCISVATRPWSESERVFEMTNKGTGTDDAKSKKKKRNEK